MKSIFGGSNIVLVHEIHNQVDRFGVCSKAYMISTVKPWSFFERPFVKTYVWYFWDGKAKADLFSCL